MKHKLTKSYCMVPHTNALPCQWCSECKQLIPMAEFGDDCTGTFTVEEIIEKARPHTWVTLGPDPGTLLVGYKGGSEYERGFFYAPYFPHGPRERQESDIRVRNVDDGRDGWLTGYPKDDIHGESCYVIWDDSPTWTIIVKRDLVARM